MKMNLTLGRWDYYFVAYFVILICFFGKVDYRWLYSTPIIWAYIEFMAFILKKYCKGIKKQPHKVKHKSTE